MERHNAVVAAVALGCSFDASGGEGGANTIGGNDTGSTTSSGATTGSASSSGDATTKPATTSSPEDSTSAAVSSGGSDADSSSGPGSSETGMLPDGLIERGLLARWFLAEAAFGIDPDVAEDAAEEPFDLPIDFSSGQLWWTEDNGHRGVRWDVAGAVGAPLRPIAGSKFDLLEGRQSGTIEVVASVEGVLGSSSRLFHIGSGNEMGDFTLRSSEIEHVEFVLNGGQVAAWAVDLVAVERAVFHLVFDTALGVEEDRVRLYVDGTFVAPESTNPPEPNEGIELSDMPYLSLGNRDGDRSIEGAVYYAAIYARPLADDEIGHNAEVLLDNDDDP